MAMTQYQCPRFHLYHAPAGQDPGCPVCAAQQAELSKTRGIWSDDPAPPAADHDRTVNQPRPDGGVAAPAGGRTIGVYSHLGMAAEPVVGWVVCIEGPDKGTDWRLVGGRNAIGRGEGMPIRLSDAGVSRQRHAVISFDPRRRSFALAPGEGQGLIYCNGHQVLVPVALAAYDRIELGASTLLLVPLVGDQFSWGG